MSGPFASGATPAFWQQSSVTTRYVHEAKIVGVSSLELPRDGRPGRLELESRATRYQDVDEVVPVDSEAWQLAVRSVTSVYADGGVFRPRRCEVGTWAWVGADRDDRRRLYQYGWMEARGVLQAGVTNNLSEFAAMLRALEAMAGAVPGWSGRACTDSEVTLGRFCDGWRLTGVPRSWERRMRVALGQLGDVEFVLLKGHPTQEELASLEQVGRRGDRTYPVSRHQVLCDSLCTRLLNEWAQLSGATRDTKRREGEQDGGSAR